MKQINSTSDTNILLTGVFGPFARDDEYGSREVNPMELYHNQVTRVQGPFSLRMFHRTFGLIMIEANIDAPCTILDFPTLDRFITELKYHRYDIIGISSIVPNIGKVRKMCEIIRRFQPEATIVVGGHIAGMDNLSGLIDADHICRGDGIRWFRHYLGQDVDAPISHPPVISGFGARILGIPLYGGHTAAAVMPSVGCPIGCNFCSTSALFGGKGHSVNFYETGDELFSILLRIEKQLHVDAFFILDENFLLYKERALRLLELMQKHSKSWAFYTFSSARVLQSYTINQLVELGVSWIWLGLEGKDSKYSKLNGVDTLSLVSEFQSHGIRVMGSTIIGMEEHTPDNIYAAIKYAVKHQTDFHQFMLYTCMPGTPLYREHRRDGTLLNDAECPVADAHGQKQFNFRHPFIPAGLEKKYLLDAFQMDFEHNGPSLARIVRTTLTGWIRYKHHPDKRIVKRFKSEITGFSTAYSGAVWAMARYYGPSSPLYEPMSALYQDMVQEFGGITRCLAPVIGRFLLWTIRREEKKLNRGWTYEPPVIYEKNAQALKRSRKHRLFPLFKTRKLLQPAYDTGKVVSVYRDKLEKASVRIQRICDDAVAELNAYTEKIDCHVIQERFLTQCEDDLQELMHRYEHIVIQCDAIRDEITSIRNAVSAKYKNARKQVDATYRQIMENCNNARSRMEQAMQDSVNACRTKHLDPGIISGN